MAESENYIAARTLVYNILYETVTTVTPFDSTNFNIFNEQEVKINLREAMARTRASSSVDAVHLQQEKIKSVIEKTMVFVKHRKLRLSAPACLCCRPVRTFRHSHSRFISLVSKNQSGSQLIC